MVTGEGSSQGGPLSPLLANIYLNEFDHEYEGRGVPVVRYADDIVLLCKSVRAASRLLESSTRYLEGKRKLKVNRDKSHIAKVNVTKKFKFLGFEFGKGQGGPLYPGTPEVDAEGEGYAQEADTAKSWKERATGHGRSEAVHARLAELLCHSIYEEYAGRVERLAAQKNPHVHLETIEEAPNQVPQFAQTRHPGKVRMDGSDEQAWLLVH